MSKVKAERKRNAKQTMQGNDVELDGTIMELVDKGKYNCLEKVQVCIDAKQSRNRVM